MTNMHTRVSGDRSKQCLLGIWSMTNMQASEFKSNTGFDAYLSLTLVNDKYAHQGVSRQVSAVPLRDLVNDKYAGQCV